MKCAYLIILMATYWMTEALPLPITSMIPMVGFTPIFILGFCKFCDVLKTMHVGKWATLYRDDLNIMLILRKNRVSLLKSLP